MLREIWNSKDFSYRGWSLAFTLTMAVLFLILAWPFASFLTAMIYIILFLSGGQVESEIEQTLLISGIISGVITTIVFILMTRWMLLIENPHKRKDKS